jgi:hypothetical protein
LLNNLEFDHADIFADLAAIETQFHHLVRTVPSEGCLVVNGAEASLERVLERTRAAFLALATTGGGGKDYAAAFRRLDLNANGTLSYKEFVAALGPLARELSSTELRELMDACDRNADGRVNEAEVLRLLKAPEPPPPVYDGPRVVNGEWVGLPEQERCDE